MAEHWTEQLYTYLNTNPFHKKIVLSDGYSQGHQWLEQICRTCGPVMNTEVHTLESIVLAAVKHEITGLGLTYVSKRDTFWIVHHLLEQLTAADDSYLPQSMLTPGVINSFHKALTELRHAAMTSAGM